MTRLTREESQAQTRQALLDTATRAFLRDGFFATSLDQVAVEAGYSKGAVYSNFRSKDQLCLAVLEHIHAEQTKLIEWAMRGSDDLGDRLQAFQEWAERIIGDPAWTGLECEFAAHARNRPDLRAELARREEAVRRQVARVIDETAEELGAVLPIPAPEAAAALLSLGIGLGMRRMVDPTVRVDVLTDMVRLLFSGASA
jgi:AcrR family transcriptional regulator